MRNRIKSTLVGGVIKPTVKHNTFFGECLTAVPVTTETPSHAQNNIRMRLIRRQASMNY